ncbi:DUF6602 domain-containing protein [Paenibacillus sp. 481]|uniref:DUF6602 domain-containing protein n=1 Tax=Paenibacillus sp. 481 TaxID=2835869 RepID=UPI001E3F6DEA|nr:DUF6602 domain-containing protein [Paenibacillus sp. 481]UHA72127.1 hypothetical protein KIK04_15635 [Paenibacillus sp. 481]
MTEKNEKNVMFKINKNYNYINTMMVDELELSSDHDGLTGNYREEMWLKFFRSIIPQKYAMAQGVKIIDSDGKVSNEVDIAVFDEQYTPYVFQYNTLKFIPIEAVVIAIECKSTGLPEDDLIEWANRIDKLNTKNSGVARMVAGYATGLTNPTQKKTRPLKILACTKTGKTERTIKNLKEDYGNHFDIIISKMQRESTKFEVVIPFETKSLEWWGQRLNNVNDELYTAEQLENKLGLQNFSASPKKLTDEQMKLQKLQTDLCPELSFDDEFYLTNTLAELKVEDNPLLSLNFQLNQLLMLINNPMLFPHFAYAKQFNKIINDEKKKEKAEQQSVKQ